MGAELATFETQLARFVGVSHCLGVGNGYDALWLSLKSLDIKPHQEVIMPSNAYIAAVNAVLALGAKPVFVEPELISYNLCAKALQEQLTTKTVAILVVHLYGQTANMAEILNAAGDIPIVEDFAQAHGATFMGQQAGSFGLINATSFYPTKNLGALGDGGAVLTNSETLAQRVSLLRNYGSQEKNIHELVGVNSRLDELQAAFLKIKLTYLQGLIQLRQLAAQTYTRELAGILDFELPQTHPSATHTYHQFVLRTKYRDALKLFLQENGINTLIHYPKPPHLQRSLLFLGYSEGSFPISESFSREFLSLPLPYAIQSDEVERTIGYIQRFAKQV